LFLEECIMFKGRLCKVMFCAILGAASISGAPMRAEEVEELMYAMNQPKIAHTLPDRADDGDDPIRKLLGHTEALSDPKS